MALSIWAIVNPVLSRGYNPRQLPFEFLGGSDPVQHPRHRHPKPANIPECPDFPFTSGPTEVLPEIKTPAETIIKAGVSLELKERGAIKADPHYQKNSQSAMP